MYPHKSLSDNKVHSVTGNISNIGITEPFLYNEAYQSFTYSKTKRTTFKKHTRAIFTSMVCDSFVSSRVRNAYYVYYSNSHRDLDKLCF